VLETLIGEHPTDIIKQHIDSDVLSLLLGREKKLCVGRKLGDSSSYYVLCTLQHHIVYLKDEILEETDNEIKFTITGLKGKELKKYIHPGKKMHTGTSESPNAPQGVRYVILGNEDPESKFKKLSFDRVHWLHMDNSTFVWKQSSRDTGMIYNYKDGEKHKSYSEEQMDYNSLTMLLAAEPGMGKSAFLSSMQHKIKKAKPEFWVLRINLLENIHTLATTELESPDECKQFLMKAAHVPKQNALPLVKEVFLKALDQPGKVTVILDGYDEVCPHYSLKVERLIKCIMHKKTLKLWASAHAPARRS
jgi:hypothetical protein